MIELILSDGSLKNCILLFSSHHDQISSFCGFSELLFWEIVLPPKSVVTGQIGQLEFAPQRLISDLLQSLCPLFSFFTASLALKDKLFFAFVNLDPELLNPYTKQFDFSTI